MLSLKPRQLLVLAGALGLVLSGCESEEAAKAKFKGSNSGKPFDKIEDKMCDEDTIERPDGWNDRRECNNDDGLFLDYATKKDKCLKLPLAKSYACTATGYLKKAKELNELDKELVRLYYASHDADKDFAAYEKSADAVLAGQVETITKFSDFVLNCWEFEQMGDLGPSTVIALQAYFPNKATTNEKLGCTMYSDFVDASPCFKGLTKLKVSGLRLDEGGEDPIKTETKFGDDDLTSGAEMDKEIDEQLEYCLTED